MRDIYRLSTETLEKVTGGRAGILKFPVSIDGCCPACGERGGEFAGEGPNGYTCWLCERPGCGQPFYRKNDHPFTSSPMRKTKDRS